jgi:signal transduction histidine kinase
MLRKHWLEAAWAVFALSNTAFVLIFREWETIPFHLVWISLVLLYCVRPWPSRFTFPLLLTVCLVSGAALTLVVVGGPQGYNELAEVPLMAAMCLLVVWYTRQHKGTLSELRRSAQREREFIRDLSHQLRTPLTIALGHAELIQESPESMLTSRAHKLPGAEIGIVIDELKRLSAIADRIVLLESADTRDLIGDDEVDLDRLLRAAARRWARTAPRLWRTSISAHGTFLGDEEQLALALDSLIENATHATAEGGQISIAGRAEGDDVIIAVSDRGRGIAEEDRERIFDRFWRGDSRYRGTGLGLSIVKAIVEAHGGSVDVESELGRGTTFSIRIGGFRPAKVVPVGVVQSIDNSRTRASRRDPQPAA